MRDVLHRLTYLNTGTPGGGAVWWSDGTLRTWYLVGRQCTTLMQALRVYWLTPLKLALSAFCVCWELGALILQPPAAMLSLTLWALPLVW